MPVPTNPIDNQRFFVWQHYADFLPKAAASPTPYPNTCDPTNPENGKSPSEPDESGLDFWTSQITATCGTGTDFNANNACTPGKRVDVSRAFWVAVYPSMFTTSYGLTSGNNATFVQDCYSIYLRKNYADPDLSGYNYWLGVLNSYGNPASQDGVNHIIQAFIESQEYRQRAGQP